ncbi:15933_t:CDS:2 [Dentiscutata erythropus]|uniref:15933_t:CDS:1 n=1 Tax=Dentiscutata erythropus TaxID=1348616 RepID=A0A9N8W022_9GLOM|nr:15933_t:CDS:2 [Dentiscutata erythropus]
MIEEKPSDEESKRKIISCYQKAANMKNADRENKNLELPKAQNIKSTEDSERPKEAFHYDQTTKVEIYQIMVKNYVIEDSDKETDIITWEEECDNWEEE